MEHVVAADLVGAVGEPVRVLVVRRGRSRCARVRRAARARRRCRPRTSSVAPSRSTTTFDDARAGVVGLEPHDLRVRQQRDVRVLERGPNADHLGIGLRVHHAREAVAVRAAHARAVRHVRLVEHDPARRVERMVPRPSRASSASCWMRGSCETGGMRVRRARRRLGRILAARAVHLVQLLGLRVVRLELVVGDRPGGRDPVVVAQLAEVLLAQPVERRAVELRGAADEVVDLRLERRAALVVPRVRRDVAVLDEDVLREPVLRLPRQPVAALEQQDALARRREMAGERAAAGSACR